MRKIINTNIRLDLSREDDRKAYEYLLHMDRKEYKSYTRAVVAAINDFFSRREKKENDPFLESREKEDRFLRQVLDTISESIHQAMSRFAFTASAAQSVPSESKPQEGLDENFAIAEDFLKEMGM